MNLHKTDFSYTMCEEYTACDKNLHFDLVGDKTYKS